MEIRVARVWTVSMMVVYRCIRRVIVDERMVSVCGMEMYLRVTVVRKDVDVVSAMAVTRRKRRRDGLVSLRTDSKPGQGVERRKGQNPRVHKSRRTCIPDFYVTLPSDTKSE
jgi:hypothetical protein